MPPPSVPQLFGLDKDVVELAAVIALGGGGIAMLAFAGIAVFVCNRRRRESARAARVAPSKGAKDSAGGKAKAKGKTGTKPKTKKAPGGSKGAKYETLGQA